MKRHYLYFLSIIMLISTITYAQIFLETKLSGPLGCGARALGMGGAFIAVADDATATTWNPGGLAQIENMEVTGVMSYYEFSVNQAAIMSLDSFQGSAYLQGESVTADLFGISLPIYPLQNKDFKIVLQYSYQRFIDFNFEASTNAIPYQRTFKYKETGQILKQDGYIYMNEKWEGGLDAHSFGLGIRPTSWADIGITFNIWTNGFEGGVYDINEFNVYDENGAVIWSDSTENIEYNELYFKGSSINIGGLFHLFNNFNIGVVFKGKFKFTVEDKDGDTQGDIYYPSSFGLGFAFRPMDNLTIAADFTTTGWSSGKAVLGGEEYFFPMTELPYDENAPVENQKQFDTHQARIGMEYVVFSEDIYIPLRLGAFIDAQYFADANYRIPGYLGITAGAGIVWKGFVLDLAAVYTSGKYLNNSNSTSRTELEHLTVTASVIYRF